MTTRIRYTKVGKEFVSNVLINYEGLKLKVYISEKCMYIVKDTKIVELEYHFGDKSKAKRLARSLLINKYKVRLINEVRQWK